MPYSQRRKVQNASQLFASVWSRVFHSFPPCEPKCRSEVVRELSGFYVIKKTVCHSFVFFWSEEGVICALFAIKLVYISHLFDLHQLKKPHIITFSRNVRPSGVQTRKLRNSGLITGYWLSLSRCTSAMRGRMWHTETHPVTHHCGNEVEDNSIFASLNLFSQMLIKRNLPTKRFSF